MACVVYTCDFPHNNLLALIHIVLRIDYGVLVRFLLGKVNMCSVDDDVFFHGVNMLISKQKNRTCCNLLVKLLLVRLFAFLRLLAVYLLLFAFLFYSTLEKFPIYVHIVR